MDDWSPPQNLRELFAEVLPVLLLLAAMWLGMFIEAPAPYDGQAQLEAR